MPVALLEGRRSMADLSTISQMTAIGVSLLATVFAIIGAIRSGFLRRIRFGGFEIEVSEREQAQARALVQAVSSRGEGQSPAEAEQLAQYYAQVLAQSKIASWFSLIFASLGFLVIVVANVRYSESSASASVAQTIAGIITEAVSALFFVQSNRAQAAMSEFSEKLRRDRQNIEARKLCDAVTNELARDALRIHLSLHYAEMKAGHDIGDSIVGACIRPLPPPRVLHPGEVAGTPKLEVAKNGDPPATQATGV